MIVFDAHLDLAWNAIDWNRDLQLPCSEIRQREIAAGMTAKARGENTCRLSPTCSGQAVVTFIATLLARLMRPGLLSPVHRLPRWRPLTPGLWATRLLQGDGAKRRAAASSGLARA